jgi:hypothetical protein
VLVGVVAGSIVGVGAILITGNSSMSVVGSVVGAFVGVSIIQGGPERRT